MTLQADAAGPTKRVLALYPHSRVMPVNLILDAVIRSRLHEKFPGPIDYEEEYVDSTKFRDPGYESQLFQFIAHKYSQSKPDVILTFSPICFDFVASRRSDFFPTVPLVAGFITEQNRLRWPVTGPTTIIYGNLDHTLTLQTALRLLPQTRHVFVVGGSASAYEKSVLASVHDQFARYEDQLTITYLTNFSLEELTHEVSHLPPHSIIYYYVMGTDLKGGVYIPREVSAALSRAANAPVFSGMSDTYMGYGIVGGNLTAMEHIGQAMADHAVAILDHPAGTRMPPDQAIPPRLLFDARELRRWHISENLLPMGSQVWFQSQTMWEQYKHRILAAGALCLAQMILIVILGRRLWRRKLAEERKLSEMENQRNRDLLAHMSRVSTVGELSSSLAHEIKQPLTAILTNAQTGLFLLRSPDADPKQLSEIFHDIVTDDQRAGDVIQHVRGMMRQETVQYKPVDLVQVVKNVLALVRTDLTLHQTSCHEELEAELPPVLGDPIQLQQVLMNLILNGVDAMSSLPIDRRRVHVLTSRSNGSVCVSVRDFGPGIPPDKLKTVFEPFYTTKPHGLGMGLSICGSIIKAHGGRIEAVNHPAGGAVMQFELPVYPNA